MLTLTLRETTAERLRRLAKARGLTVEETIEELIERAGPMSPVRETEREAKAAKYNLEADDPLLDLIGVLGAADTDAVTLVDETMDDFYRSHRDSPR